MATYALIGRSECVLHAIPGRAKCAEASLYKHDIGFHVIDPIHFANATFPEGPAPKILNGRGLN